MKLKLPQLRVIPYQRETAKFNMAADYYLMKHNREPTLRFYGWQKPSLSFGKNQKKITDIDFDYCQKENFAFVFRPSGGRTVFHDHELTYCLSAPERFFTPSVLETYLMINQAFVAALDQISALNLQAEADPKDRSSNCFATSAKWEVRHQERKLIGSAQTRHAKAVLQHGSLLLDVALSKWQGIWPQQKNSSWRNLTALNQISPRRYSPEQLANLLLPALCSAWEVKTPEIKKLTAHERKTITTQEPRWRYPQKIAE